MTKVLLVGCGRMGSALLSGWLDRGIAAADLVVVDPTRPTVGPVTVVADADSIPPGFVPDVVVLAVKPQMMDAALPPYRRFVATALFLSIAAGKPTAYFRRAFGDDLAIVRAMPNTPAAVRRGITVCFADETVSADRRALAASLLEAVGEVGWISDESQMDAVTALSGSGPAYVFLLAEAMAEAGVALGLDLDLAVRLARATVAGSGELLRLSADSAGDLRRAVTSPAGTTAAALAVLMDETAGFGPLLRDAIAAAEHRSRELAG
ncbi:pyrroline-5-carboxylate reductase [Magnetospirillum molischianum]|uniref:Pyrroline-5-carboxylate reductase n=1 Tax=Magnetospirillum molischianum DSM 120 TaxID=1150626 RepID=H8FT65_MAGML|nr:pyrroline-5-carboxylate reductase [Magnetospirillum molischianum]CCG41553.1 Pyrroline-5-carboxylate reductase [Magnetospirillum molischianum DSM 120]